ncbi:hypothetical protein [Streptomyces europaeiscabiei]|uniref:hypothetical protein n=1 Tax=Streptomyces europaeiscabiei TaxID=146819 RepID=UPI0029B34EE3|nr:hypothetical protein [Streptomyces europaeiscabiei]MDX3841720.1 hypothetical protein [Streptomyces europaeiscabiei]
MIDLNLVMLSLEIAPFDATGIEYEPDTPFRCDLAAEPHEMHGSFLRLVPDDDRQVFFFWDASGAIDYLICLSPCDKSKPDHKEPCCLWREHSGECEWAIIDPAEIAITAALDQAGLLFKEAIGISDLLGVLRPPEKEM